MTNPIPIKWYKPSERLPDNGLVVIIREYYRSAKTGKFRTDYAVFYYFEDYGFKIEERKHRQLELKVTHWLPIPPLNYEKV